jgi:hypothetical protein
MREVFPETGNCPGGTAIRANISKHFMWGCPAVRGAIRSILDPSRCSLRIPGRRRARGRGRATAEGDPGGQGEPRRLRGDPRRGSGHGQEPPEKPAHVADARFPFPLSLQIVGTGNRAQQPSWARRSGPWAGRAPCGKRQPKRPRSRHSAGSMPLTTPSRGRQQLAPPGSPTAAARGPASRRWHPRTPTLVDRLIITPANHSARPRSLTGSALGPLALHLSKPV